MSHQRVSGFLGQTLRADLWELPGKSGKLPGNLGSAHSSGKKKTNKHKHFGRDGVRDKHEPSLGQTRPLPGTNWEPSGQTGRFQFNSTVKSPFCPVCPWDRWGFVPETIVPQRPPDKVFSLNCFFFRPQIVQTRKKHIKSRLAPGQPAGEPEENACFPDSEENTQTVLSG